MTNPPAMPKDAQKTRLKAGYHLILELLAEDPASLKNHPLKFYLLSETLGFLSIEAMFAYPGDAERNKRSSLASILCAAAELKDVCGIFVSAGGFAVKTNDPQLIEEAGSKEHEQIMQYLQQTYSSMSDCPYMMRIVHISGDAELLSVASIIEEPEKLSVEHLKNTPLQVLKKGDSTLTSHGLFSCLIEKAYHLVNEHERVEKLSGQTLPLVHFAKDYFQERLEVELDETWLKNTETLIDDLKAGKAEVTKH